MRRAFSMVELVFVIVIIGILAGIAIQKMSITRDDATITKARSQVASIRSAITNEVQRRMMEGNYTQIKNVGGTIIGYNNPDDGYNTKIFDFFDTNADGSHDANASRVLEYPPYSCKERGATGCWIRSGETYYIYYAPDGENVDFNVSNNRFECDNLPSNNTQKKKELCRMLDR